MSKNWIQSSGTSTSPISVTMLPRNGRKMHDSWTLSLSSFPFAMAKTSRLKFNTPLKQSCYGEGTMTLGTYVGGQWHLPPISSIAWLPCDPDAIISDHGHVFDEDNNEIGDLAQYPLQDPKGNRISIFDQYGTCIECWELAINEDEEGGGILFDLDGASTLLHSVDEDGEPMLMELHSYPQAFLPQYGHIHSTGVIPEIPEEVCQINQTLMDGLLPDDQDQDDAEFQAELEEPLKATF